MKQFLSDVFRPLSPQQRRSIGLLIFLSFLTMVLVTVGVGTILPMVAIVLDPDSLRKYRIADQILEMLGNPSQQSLLLGTVVLFVLTIYLKVSLTLWVLVRQKKLDAEIKAGVANRLFESYLALPYLSYLRMNSSKIVRSIGSDTRALAACINAAIVIFTESLVSVALLGVLIIVDPVGLTLLLLLVGVFGAIYFFTMHSKIDGWGRKSRRERARVVKYTNEALGAFKEIKVLDRLGFFQMKLVSTFSQMVSFERRYAVIQGVPANTLEFLAATGILTLALASNLQGESVKEFVPVLALFIASVARLGPSLARVAAGFQQIRFSRPGLQALRRQLDDTKDRVRDNKDKSQPTNTLFDWHELIIKNLSFSYPSREGFSLSDVNLSVRRRSSLGIVGESGSGKSTLVDIILGLIENYDGTIFLDRTNFAEIRDQWQAEIGYVPQSVYLIDDTLRRNIAIGVKDEAIDEARVRSAVEKAQLRSFVDSLEEGLDSVVGERGALISGGQQQRIGIARALYRNPSILILDEATSSLDLETERGFMNTVAEMHGSITMIIIAHRISTLRHCDRIIRLHRGRIVEESSFEKLISNA